MITSTPRHSVMQPQAPRLWILETAVVLGIIAFGYFAIGLDGRWTGAQAQIAPVSITEPAR